jgi:hypothetical protein
MAIPLWLGNELWMELSIGVILIGLECKLWFWFGWTTCWMEYWYLKQLVWNYTTEYPNNYYNSQYSNNPREEGPQIQILQAQTEATIQHREHSNDRTILIIEF